MKAEPSKDTSQKLEDNECQSLPDLARTTATAIMKIKRTRMEPAMARMNLFLWSNLNGSFSVSCILKDWKGIEGFETG